MDQFPLDRPTLFEGKKKGFAEHLARTLLPASHLPHPDCTIYTPAGKSYIHSIESLLDLHKEAHRQPHSASRIILILDEADKMPLLGSQTLLKILEEPPKTTLFILIAASRHSILPTLLSRCQVIRIESDKKSGALEKPLLHVLEQGKTPSLFVLQERLEPLLPYFEEEEGRQEAISLFFSTLLAWFRDIHLLSIDPLSSQLLLPEYKEKAFQALQKGEMVPFELLFKAVNHAKVSFERFTAPKQILESLFIELGALA